MRNSPQADIDILKHILRYCNNIEALILRFGNDYAVFREDMAFRDSISMNILHLTTHSPTKQAQKSTNG